MKTILASLMLMSASIDSEIKFRPNLTLDQQHQISTNGGILNPSEIIKLKANDYIIIYLPDGTRFSGMITKTEFKNKDHFECFGEMHSHKNTGFGFILTKEGVFAGAIVLRDADTIFNITYSKEANGYILIRQLLPSNLL